MKHALVQVVFSLFPLTLSAAVMAEKAPQWETATVISPYLPSSAPGVPAVPGMIVDVGAYRYMWQEITPDGEPFSVVTVHDQVKFYRDGKWFVVLDSEGKKHVFRLFHSVKFE